MFHSERTLPAGTSDSTSIISAMCTSEPVAHVLTLETHGTIRSSTTDAISLNYSALPYERNCDAIEVVRIRLRRTLA